MNYKTAIGEKIRTARRARKLTQVRLALSTKVSSEFISRIERGMENPSLETLIRIARGLKTTVSDLTQDIEKAEL